MNFNFYLLFFAMFLSFDDPADLSGIDKVRYISSAGDRDNAAVFHAQNSDFS